MCRRTREVREDVHCQPSKPKMEHTSSLAVAGVHITSVPLFRVRILRINATRAHFEFINKTAR